MEMALGLCRAIVGRVIRRDGSNPPTPMSIPPHSTFRRTQPWFRQKKNQSFAAVVRVKRREIRQPLVVDESVRRGTVAALAHDDVRRRRMEDAIELGLADVNRPHLPLSDARAPVGGGRLDGLLVHHEADVLLREPRPCVAVRDRRRQQCLAQARHVDVQDAIAGAVRDRAALARKLLVMPVAANLACDDGATRAGPVTKQPPK